MKTKIKNIVAKYKKDCLDAGNLLTDAELTNKLIEDLDALFSLYDVSSRLPFKEELDKMCEHYIQATEEEDKTKWHDNTIADKVKHWCKWIKVFAKENGY